MLGGEDGACTERFVHPAYLFAPLRNQYAVPTYASFSRFDVHLAVCFRPAHSRGRPLHIVLFSVFKKGFARKGDCLRNGFFTHSTSPFFDNRLPSHPARNLLQHLPNHNARAAKGWLAVTDFWIRDNVTSQNFSAHTRHSDSQSTPIIHHLADFFFAPSTNSHNRFGDTGISKISNLYSGNTSSNACAKSAPTGIAPASPAPLTPIGFQGDGVSSCPTCMRGTSIA